LIFITTEQLFHFQKLHFPRIIIDNFFIRPENTGEREPETSVTCQNCDKLLSKFRGSLDRTAGELKRGRFTLFWWQFSLEIHQRGSVKCGFSRASALPDFNCKVRNNMRLSINFSVNAITRWDTENSGKLCCRRREL